MNRRRLKRRRRGMSRSRRCPDQQAQDQGKLLPVQEPSIESAPASPEVTQEEMEKQVWKKSMLGLMARVMQHKHAQLFNNPVSEVVATEYRDLVYRPMDLGSIKKNIESGHIDS